MRLLDFLKILTLLSIAAIYSPGGRAASQWQDRAAILAAARDHLQARSAAQFTGRTELRLGALDPRLRLKACTGPLETFTPPGARPMGNTTVGVRCPGPDGWSLYLSARIDVYGPVLVLRQPLARGSVVREADLDLVEHNLAELPYGYYTDPGAVTGMVTRRAVNAASVLNPQVLQAPRLVKRGQDVVLVAETGGLSIRSAGQALSDGRDGDRVRVRATGSGRIIDGIVVSAGVIKVTL
ncbi:MAG TPA: flagellar basal body P-ring formation protein FlgA [Gammaproteobacteria bacterium]|nr:flagellar basal body P-ring formation protein FlgA [Gammaproteobacteria bacterium]